MKPQNCPNCEVKLSGILASNYLLSAKENSIIHEFNGKKEIEYCSKCGQDLYNEAFNNLVSRKTSLFSKLENAISLIPVVSANTPLNWNYEVIDMVTAQSTTGTGVISEFTSSFTDLFGLQSNRYNKKLKSGEDFCFAQLRKKAMDMGANAIIATDIDYSEIGGDKGMLMVCMAGTAVNLKNIEILGVERSKGLSEILDINNQLNNLLPFFEVTNQ